MAKKPYTVKKEIGGVEYVAQFNGMSVALDAVDSCYTDNGNNISVGKLAKYLFEHVIVEPKGLTVDDFDNMDDLNAVVGFGREVMQGNFREEAQQSATNKKS